MCVAVAGATYLVIDHWWHLVGAWPLLFLLVCPALHVLLHGRHGGHRSHGDGPGR
jgi:hypothetical protein